MLVGAGHGGEGHPVDPGGQQALAPARAEQVGPLAGRQPEGLGQGVDGLGGLAQQDLGGGVGDHGLAERGAQQVGGVLGDDGEPGPVLAGRLGHAEEELGAGRLGHEQPGLVDHDQPPSAVGPGSDTGRQMASRVSSVPAAFSSSGRSRRLEDDEVAVGAGGGRPVEEAPVGAGDERRQPGGQGAGAPGRRRRRGRGQVARAVGAGRAWLRGSAVIPTDS